VRRLSERRAERPSVAPKHEIPAVIHELLSGGVTDRGARMGLLRRLAVELGHSARRAGAAAVGSGQWITDSVMETAPHIPIRDLQTLSDHHGGLQGNALAEALVATAARSTGAIGVAGGLVASLEFATPPLLLTTPVQIAAETLAVVAIELKLVAELHEVYGHPAAGTGPVKTAAYLGAWTRRHALVRTPGRAGVLITLNAGRRELRRRILRRAGTNMTTIIPFLGGAVAGATLNSRETRRLAEQMVRELGGWLP
jgi:hypothetical protein